MAITFSSKKVERSPRTSSVFDIDENSMKTNKAEQVSSFLISMVVMVGLAVAMLFLLFLLQLNWQRPQEMILEVEQIAGRGDNAAGFERDFDLPGADEVEQLQEPALEQTLQMVTDAISTIATSMDSVTTAAAVSGEGTGKGDSRPPGPEGDGIDAIHRAERWELKFTARDRKGYASQLDAFGIELAAIGGGINTIDYASNLAKSPQSRSGTRDEEKRLVFTYTANNALAQYDKLLLQAAGVPLKDRTVLKFIPKETEDLLATAEKAHYLANRSKDFLISDIAKTIFECRVSKNGKLDWVVVGQRYRNRNPSVK
jgi:hypothetical protein